MRPLDLTPSGVLGTLAVFVVAAICIRLGFWQLDRRQQRLEHNAAVAERLAAPRLSLDDPPADTAGLQYRRAMARGRFDNARSVVLAGRSHAGAPGVHLLTPLRTGDGAILVNRGWLPAADAATADLEPVVLEGDVVVEGVLLPFPEVDVDRQPGGFRATWFRFHGDGIRSQLPYPTAPLYLLATVRPSAVSADSAPALPVLLDPPALDAGPHLSYAIQWFSFATIFLVGWAVILARRGDAGPDRRDG